MRIDPLKASRDTRAASIDVGQRRLLSVSAALALVVGIGAASTSFDVPWGDSSPAAATLSQHAFRPDPRLCSRTPSTRKYVSPTGRDSNLGSVKHPWRTVGRALRAARAGIAIVVRSGTYGDWAVADKNGVESAPISLRAYAGEHPVMTGRLKITGAYICVTGLRFEGRTAANEQDVLIYVSGAHHIEIRRNEVMGSAMSGIYVGDESDPSEDVSIIGNHIYGNGTHDRLDHGVYFGNVNQGLISNNLVVGNLAIGLKMAPEANQVIVTQNTVVGNGLAGILVGGEESFASNDDLVVNNIVAFSDGWGIRTYWEEAIGSGNLAIRNLVFANRAGPFWFPGGGMVAQQSILADPRFGSGDYRLRRGSPAVNRAIAAFSMPVDFDERGRLSSARPDLGAYER